MLGTGGHRDNDIGVVTAHLPVPCQLPAKKILRLGLKYHNANTQWEPGQKSCSGSWAPLYHLPQLFHSIEKWTQIGPSSSSLLSPKPFVKFKELELVWFRPCLYIGGGRSRGWKLRVLCGSRECMERLQLSMKDSSWVNLLLIYLPLPTPAPPPQTQKKSIATLLGAEIEIFCTRENGSDVVVL